MELIHGGDLTSYRERYPGRDVLDFSANINPLGMPEGVKKALADSQEVCIHYPDPLCRDLTRAISRFEDVPEEWILCGNGASDLIWRMVWTVQPQRALLPAPTFADYGQSLAAFGSYVRHHYLSEETGFAVDDTILDRIDGSRLLFLCNPNNPTGLRISQELLEMVLRQCKKTGTVLVMDECFLDFESDGESQSMKRYLAQEDNLVIIRAFTKLFAMPGLRLGYLLCSNEKLLSRLARMGPTWSVSAVAQLCGIAATMEDEYLRVTRCMLPIWRGQLLDGLNRLGCKVYPSSANYLFFKSRPGLAAELQPHGILLRDCANYTGLSQGYYRTAVRTEEENQLLLEKMGELLHEE